MRKVKIILIVCVLMFLLVSSALATDMMQDAVYTESFENESGQNVDIYTDDRYEYYINDDGEMIGVVYTIDEMEKIIDNFDASDVISGEQAYNRMYEELQELYPEYDTALLQISCNNITGNPVEYYIFTIEEIIDNSRVNVASIALAYDGSLASAYGTHNTYDKFEDAEEIYSGDAAEEIAFEYLKEHQEEIESGMKPTEPVDDSTVIAQEGMVVPDGVEVGEAFSYTQLPDFYLLLDSVDDLDDISIIRVLYQGRVAWSVEFILHTSWGEVSPVFDPDYTILVDEESGQVLRVMQTDGTV